VRIVGPDRLLGETLRVVLESHGMEVVLSPDPAAAAAEVRATPTDLVVIDLDDREGGRLGKVLLERDAELKVAGLTTSHDERALTESVRAGFHAYVTRESSVQGFVNALERTLAGGVVRPPRRRRGPGEGRRSFSYPSLTRREAQILKSLAEGAANREIARRMGISPHTVRTHIQSILAKLQAHTRLEAVAWARRNGLVE
jgi:two-component system nitrate/nitrite response regulator NarL